MSDKNKSCHCTLNDTRPGTKLCRHGVEFETVTHADRLRDAIEKLRKLSRSPKIKELLDDMLDDVEGVEMDAQECYDDWQSECEGRVEDQNAAAEAERAADKQIAALDEALDAALGDRQALLERLGLTDFAWAMQGGIPEAHMEARAEE